MKLELNNENKAKFFALYYGLDLITHETATYYLDLPSYIYDVEERGWDESIFYLELTPLSDISDEDLDKIGCDDRVLLEYEIETYEAPNWVFDQLRYLGYALPWMGISVEEMIEAGWIKLKPSK